MFVFYIFAAVIAILVANLFWNHRSKPPGPWGLPIVGYLPWIDPLHPYKTFEKLSKKYGEIFSVQLGNINSVVLTNPKTIRTLFNKDVTTGRAPLFLTHGIMKGYGIICSEGELWKDTRKFVHGFLKQLGASKVGQHKNKLESVIKQYIAELLKKISETDEQEEICPLKLFGHSIGSFINHIVFGRSWSEDDPTWIWLQEIQDEGAKLMGVAGPLNFLPFLRFIPKYRNTIKFLTKGQSHTHSLYYEIIRDHKKVMEEKPPSEPDHLIEAFLMERQKRSEDVVEKFYNDNQFLHLLSDIFGAGLDTTLSTIRWYLLYISKYPAIQDKVRQEIKDILQGRSPSLEDISDMTLFEASLNEVFRIRPVVPLGIPHGVLQDLEIEGYRIPKGTMIIPVIWAIHMDETVWRNPDEFNPSRFIDDEGKIIKFENLMPFQTGKRMCVGDQFAKMILGLYLVSILQKFRIELVDSENVDLNGICGLTMSPINYKLIFCKDD